MHSYNKLVTRDLGGDSRSPLPTQRFLRVFCGHYEFETVQKRFKDSRIGGKRGLYVEEMEIGNTGKRNWHLIKRNFLRFTRLQ